MIKKNETEKVCLCGRIITDPNNKMGLCPKCQKLGNNLLGIGGFAALGVGLKKFVPKILKGAIKIIKK
jgi:hypothetical protein